MKKNEVMKKVSKQVSRKMKTNVKFAVGSPEYFEQIKLRAHEIYEGRIKKGLPGDQISDWIQAEKEIKSQAENRGANI